MSKNSKFYRGYDIRGLLTSIPTEIPNVLVPKRRTRRLLIALPERNKLGRNVTANDIF